DPLGFAIAFSISAKAWSKRCSSSSCTSESSVHAVMRHKFISRLPHFSAKEIRRAGEPEALRAWFYPGRQSGEEFVYGKARALILAKETHTAVLFFTPAEIAPEVAVAIKTPAEPVVVELEKAPVMAVQPTGEEVEIAQVVTPPPAVLVAQNDAPALPATGSSLPLVALFGMLALAGALTLGLLQKRTL